MHWKIIRCNTGVRYLLRQCDRVYFPGSSTHVKMLGLDVSEIGSRFFVNHPILQDMFVTGHNSNGLVFAGGVPPFDNRECPRYLEMRN